MSTPAKLCPACFRPCPRAVRVCPYCSHAFKRKGAPAQADIERKRLLAAQRKIALNQRNELLGRKRRDYALNDNEHRKVKEYIKRLRNAGVTNE